MDKRTFMLSFAGGLMGAGATLLLWSVAITIYKYIGG